MSSITGVGNKPIKSMDEKSTKNPIYGLQRVKSLGELPLPNNNISPRSENRLNEKDITEIEMPKRRKKKRTLSFGRKHKDRTEKSEKGRTEKGKKKEKVVRGRSNSVGSKISKVGKLSQSVDSVKGAKLHKEPQLTPIAPFAPSKIETKAKHPPSWARLPLIVSKNRPGTAAFDDVNLGTGTFGRESVERPLEKYVFENKKILIGKDARKFNKAIRKMLGEEVKKEFPNINQMPKQIRNIGLEYLSRSISDEGEIQEKKIEELWEKLQSNGLLWKPLKETLDFCAKKLMDFVNENGGTEWCNELLILLNTLRTIKPKYTEKNEESEIKSKKNILDSGSQLYHILSLLESVEKDKNTSLFLESVFGKNYKKIINELKGWLKSEYVEKVVKSERFNFYCKFREIKSIEHRTDVDIDKIDKVQAINTTWKVGGVREITINGKKTDIFSDLFLNEGYVDQIFQRLRIVKDKGKPYDLSLLANPDQLCNDQSFSSLISEFLEIKKEDLDSSEVSAAFNEGLKEKIIGRFEKSLEELQRAVFLENQSLTFEKPKKIVPQKFFLDLNWDHVILNDEDFQAAFLGLDKDKQNYPTKFKALVKFAAIETHELFNEERNNQIKLFIKNKLKENQIFIDEIKLKREYEFHKNTLKALQLKIRRALVNTLPLDDHNRHLFSNFLTILHKSGYDIDLKQLPEIVDMLTSFIEPKTKEELIKDPTDFNAQLIAIKYLLQKYNVNNREQKNRQIAIKLFSHVNSEEMKEKLGNEIDLLLKLLDKSDSLDEKDISKDISILFENLDEYRNIMKRVWDLFRLCCFDFGGLIEIFAKGTLPGLYSKKYFTFPRKAPEVTLVDLHLRIRENLPPEVTQVRYVKTCEMKKRENTKIEHGMKVTMEPGNWRAKAIYTYTASPAPKGEKVSTVFMIPKLRVKKGEAQKEIINLFVNYKSEGLDMESAQVLSPRNQEKHGW